MTREITGAKDGSNVKAALDGADDEFASPVPDRGRSPDPVRRQRWLAGVDGAAD
jgi:hypothetical protein